VPAPATQQTEHLIILSLQTCDGRDPALRALGPRRCRGWRWPEERLRDAA
jgi:hypothetical protein